jgi:TetR/AcrR family transcriptional repressor of nem operon
MPTPAAASDSASRILDVAERLVQTRGFNAFSYADVAETLHVTKASLHYHFPTKAKLGEHLIERYRASFLAALERIDGTGGDAGAKLSAYVGIYADVLEKNRMCLCGMLAADYATLPKAMREGVRRFFDANEAWLVAVLERGRDRGELGFAGPPVETARFLVAALEGAMLLARSHGDASRLRAAGDHLLAGLGVRAPVPADATA